MEDVDENIINLQYHLYRLTWRRVLSGTVRYHLADVGVESKQKVKNVFNRVINFILHAGGKCLDVDKSS